MNLIPWLTILMLFVVFNFAATIIINMELDNSNVPNEKLKNIRTFNGITQLTSIVFITIIITSFITRRIGCKERTSGKNFTIIAQLALFIFVIIVFTLNIMCLIDENFNLLKDTSVKTWLVAQLASTSLLVVFGIFQLYNTMYKPTEKKKKYNWE
jgi:hypothetical protein